MRLRRVCSTVCVALLPLSAAAQVPVPVLVGDTLAAMARGHLASARIVLGSRTAGGSGSQKLAAMARIRREKNRRKN